jgi:hypothetical protein
MHVHPVHPPWVRPCSGSTKKYSICAKVREASALLYLRYIFLCPSHVFRIQNRNVLAFPDPEAMKCGNVVDESLTTIQGH